MRTNLFVRDRSPLPVIAALVALVAALAVPDAVTAQEGAVTGQVTDASNLEPVVGAQVFFPELDLGTLTDADGRYRITGVPAGSHTIRVRLLGYREAVRSVTIEAGETASLDLQLSVSAVSLSELVVTQTGVQQARELGRAVSTIDAAQEVQKSKSRTVQDLIKGRSTGTIIRSSSGSVGTGSTFQIRGNTTLSLDNTPLIYIDGVRVANGNSNLGGMFFGNFFTGGQQTSRISDLNPDDIESIQVLKGPAATTLYGSEAASGVIVIETKQGRSGDTQWTGHAQAGGNWDSTDWMGVAYDTREDPTAPLPFAKDTVYLMNLLEGKAAGIPSPWRTGLEQKFGGTVRGGVDEGAITYYVSGEYDTQEGNLPTNGVTKWNARANMNIAASDVVDISLSNGFTSNETTLPQNDNNSFGIVSNALLGLAFWDSFLRADPIAGGAPIRTCPLAFELARAGVGPLSALSQDGVVCEFPGGPGRIGGPFLTFAFDDAFLTRTVDDTQRYTGSGTLSYRPWEFLSNRLTVGYDEFDQTNRQVIPVVPRLVAADDSFEGFLQQAKSRGSNLTIQGTSTAEFALSESVSSTTTAGIQWFDEQQDQVFLQCQTFPAGSPACDNSVSLDQTGSNDFFVEERTLGLFAEQRFGWREIVYLTAGVRVDDNSAFGEELSAEAFPQFSLSYILSDEAFFPSFFDQFKLRAAWGQSGEQPGTNAAFALLGANPAAFRGQDVISVTPGEEPGGAGPAQPGNPSLEPARVTEVEVGVDMSVLSDRLSGEVTWYRQTTKNDIVTRPLPPSAGFANAQFTNVGELVNTGVEVALNATALSQPDLFWDWRAQVSTNFNEITELTNPIDLGFEQRHIEGRPFASFFDNAVFFDENGVIQATPRDVFSAPGVPGGDPTPNVTGSLSTTLTLFNHVTLYALGEFATGHQIHSNTQEFVCQFINLCARVLEVGTDGLVTDRARLLRAAGPLGAELNFVEDADYVKLRTVSARFDLPDAWTEFFSGRDVSFQLTGENLAAWYSYFMDPELTSGGQEQNAFFSDFLTVPPAKRVTASLRVTF